MDEQNTTPTVPPIDPQELWARLASFEVADESVPFGFTRRLARDNGWSEEFAVRVMEEYRRFLFLGQVASHPVSPSDEVDQAWHLHLTYTHSYWNDLCGEILGRPFHHGPTIGGEAETAKYNDLYVRTLQSYKEWLGQEPPPDIWPDPARRFGDAPAFVRVNAERSWIVPKPSTQLIIGACVTLVLLVFLATWNATTAVSIFFAVVFVAMLAMVEKRNGPQRGWTGRAGGCGGCAGCGGCGGCGG